MRPLAAGAGFRTRATEHSADALGPPRAQPPLEASRRRRHQGLGRP